MKMSDLFKNIGKKGNLPFKENKQGAVNAPTKMTEEEMEEEKKKREGYLRYNRKKNGIFGDKNEPELIKE